MSYERLRYILIVLLVVIAALYLIGLAYHTALSFAGIIFLYFMAWLISFLLSPVVDWLGSHRFPRLLAVIYVYVVLAALMVVLVLAVVPTVITEAARLTDPRQLGEYQRMLTHRVADMQTFLVEHTPLPKANITRLVAEWNRQLIAQFQQINSNLVSWSGWITGTAVSVSINIVQASLNWLVNAVIILVLSFYMTLDGKRLMASVSRFLPESWTSEIEAIDASIARSFGGYIRGQVLLALIYAGLTYVTLLWFHTAFAVILAIFAGLMMLIPFIGTFLAIIPPLVVAGLQATGTSGVLWLAVALVVWQQVTLNVLAPRILGDSVGMHPLLVFLGVLLGAKLAGPLGAIFGVPVLGVLLTIVEVISRRLLMRRHVGARAEDGETTQTVPAAIPSTQPPPGPVPAPVGGAVDPHLEAAFQTALPRRPSTPSLVTLVVLGRAYLGRHLPRLLRRLNDLGQAMAARRHRRS